ncbi:MAG: DUF58 domain-containing protein [Verrucomicrobiaceae bacterium]
MEMTGGSRFFYRWLCKNYRSGSAVGFFVRRRVTPLAWFLMGLLLISMMLGANVNQSVVVMFSALLTGLLGVGLIWAFLRRAKVSVVREVPRSGSVGEALKYSVRVTNEGRSILRDIFLRETGDDPRPTEWEFLNLKEPGEEKRNIWDRVFAFYRWKWLTDRGGRWRSLGRSKGLVVGRGKSVETRLSLLPNRRGVLRLNDVRVELPDPFGFFRRCRKTSGSMDEIVVIPRRYRLPELRLQGKSELKVGGETASNVRGEGGEFLGLREYQQGDSLRKIDWKAWARTGEPIVKENEEARFPRYGLVLDTSLRSSGPGLFEEAVSVAASFVSTMDRNRCLLDLMFVHDSPVVFTAGRGVARAEKLMEVLARVEGSEVEKYDQLKGLVLRYASEMTACVVVLSGWSEERRNFVELLRLAGLEVHVYVIGAGEAPEEARGMHWLRWDHVQEDLLMS